ncbi:MAG TPA: PSD1 and planctomycete cytochrome C domain-containing protein, partial [Planctomycetota bacterium]|nr:PSD1 and planctomycete cytochrome C domain-containing protein [Planctomycetota bacterium]
MKITGAFLLAGLALGLAPQDPAAPPKVDFSRDIQPVFAASCAKCHGPEKPKGQFRLDSKPHAMKGGIGGPAILPGKGQESPLVQLLLATDPEERMPRKAEALPREKIELIRRWIDEGAVWPDTSGPAGVERHWAYVKPVRPELPKVREPGWVRSPIDRFILSKLEKEGLAPAPEASPETLLRRVSLDLTGLPPSPEDLDLFLSDGSPGAYEKAVDRLLAQPAYGERWARPWLDLARYADTNGFNFDTRRTMWKYRDWVIDALNRDLPFDQFTVEQIAGDLLPGASFEQRIATGFHRNTMTNEEGGTDPAEARWETLIDRTNTTAAVWLGATFACAQCHNHKYDPFSQKDYYRFLAFFENSDEPKIELLSPEEKAERTRLRGEMVREERELHKAELPAHIVKAIETPIEKRTNTNRNDIVIYCRAQAPAELRPITSKLLELNSALERLDGSTALVLQERATTAPPSTHVRIKGGFTNVGERVEAGVPASLHPMAPGDPRNRLGLARWLVSPENPLVARVVVNRFWGEIFGRPIVESPEDFGTQGLPPTHPELLDWLATEIVARGWSMKAIHRTIVLSATYRQSSRSTPELQERDPLNRLLAHGPRFRMEAEMIRDVVLSASGLLHRKIGGPSVFPLQCDMSGVVAINKVDTSWAPSPGEDRYRRGLYTHWRRTAPYAAFMTFDAPSRECCIVRRQRTNTPLQA